MMVAHVFLTPYTLPVPFWLYLYGCAATLVLSFALLAYLATAHSEAPALGWRRTLHGGSALWRLTGAALRALGLAAFALTITAGAFGPSNPNTNVAMTLFWVCFLLALTYLTTIVGDAYSWTNPWTTLADLLRAAGIDMDKQRIRYPDRASYWPAVAWYLALVWIELFALPRPALLSIALAVYTGVTLAGMYAFGRDIWLRHGDMFGVFFRVVGSLAPIEYVRQGEELVPRFHTRRPLDGALKARAEHVSVVVFILFMLSSTTYDALHGTYFWISLYWQRLIPMLQPMWGSDVIAAQAMLTTGYWWYQWLGLVLSPAFYLALYLAALYLAAALTRSSVTIGSLAAQFAFSLVPIAVAYHATHYLPSMLMQLPQLAPQLADPFGRGWELVPFPSAPQRPLPMSIVWHAQVAVLLAGHVAGVYLAHLIALRVFPTRGQGIVSQLPMLALMVGYTSLGLWILSLPLGAG
jgi:hypothetical protein